MQKNEKRQPIPLHGYQIAAKEFVLEHPHCGLFLEMGLGKTAIVLEALQELRETGRLNTHVLVIAPKTIARTTWINEIKKWHVGLKPLSLVVNDNGKQLTKEKRELRYESILATDPVTDPLVCLANRDQIAKLTEYFLTERHTWPFETVIIDESQSFKSYSSERFRALKTVRTVGVRQGYRSLISRMVLLSGSPAPNGPEDLWSQIYLLDMGASLGRTITEYRERYFRPGLIVNGHPANWQVRPGMEDEIYRKIRPLVISMKNTYIKLPPVTYTDDTVYMSDDEKKTYKELMKNSVLTLADGTEIEAANAAVLSGKLTQMAGGSLYLQTGLKDYTVIHEHKLEMCRYIIDNAAGNVIIAFRFRSESDMLMKYLADLSPEIFDGSPEMEDRWNRGEIRVMLLQPASNGAGVNLQYGGHTLIWYTLPWSLEQYEQTNTRLYRQGQKDPVIIHRIMTDGTIDAHVLYALEKKDLSQQALLDAVEATVADADT